MMYRYPKLIMILTIAIILIFTSETGCSKTTTSPEDEAVTGLSTLQVGNNLTITRFKAKMSNELEDNHIGALWDLTGYFVSAEDWRGFVKNFEAVGYKRIRLISDYGDYEWVDLSKREELIFTPNPYADEIIKAMNESGVKVILCLVFWDKQCCQKEEHIERYTRFQSQDEVDRYIDYVRSMTKRFKGLIDYYEIWNEPTVEPGTQQSIEVNDYIDMAKQVIPVIRLEDPEAKVMVGAFSGLREPTKLSYFFNVLKSDIMPLVDGISFHPLYGESPKFEELKDYYYDYPSLAQEIKDTAFSHGFQGEVLADEMCWRTVDEPDPYEIWIYSPLEAAKYYARAIITNLAMGFVVTPGMVHPDQPDLPKSRVIRNLCTLMSGAEPTSLQTRIESTATNIKVYALNAPNGNVILALWTDDTALDEDRGVESTLTIVGFIGEKVVAVDILNSSEQELLTSVEGDNLVIRSLLVKDYPTILRISP